MTGILVCNLRLISAPSGETEIMAFARMRLSDNFACSTISSRS